MFGVVLINSEVASGSSSKGDVNTQNIVLFEFFWYDK